MPSCSQNPNTGRQIFSVPDDLPTGMFWIVSNLMALFYFLFSIFVYPLFEDTLQHMQTYISDCHFNACRKNILWNEEFFVILYH